MFLRHRKVGKGLKISTNIADYCPLKLEESELKSLVSQLKSNENTEYVENRLYEGHIRLAIRIVGKYAYFLRKSALIEELLDEAIMGIIEGIKLARTKLQDDNITPYIVAVIHRKLSAFIRHEYKGNSQVSKYTISRKPSIINQGLETVDIQDELENLLQESTDIEKLVVYLRLEGYNDVEIGKELNHSKQFINIIRSRIGKKYRRQK